MRTILKILFILSILYTTVAFLDKLPEGSLLKNAKVNYHRQHFCILKTGDLKCYEEQKPGNLEEIMKMFDVYKEVQVVE